MTDSSLEPILATLERIVELRDRGDQHDPSARDLPSGTDPQDLSQTGWAILFAEGSEALGEHFLADLIDRRRGQAEQRFCKKSVRKGENGCDFLWLECNESPGVIDLDLLPYYVLLIGKPDEISFDFQNELSVNRAVGRLSFDDPRDLEHYAASVLAIEGDEEESVRQATFCHFETDELTQYLGRAIERHLVPVFSSQGWDSNVVREQQASDENLLEALDVGPPEFLSLLAHGLRVGFGRSIQPNLQGALVLGRDSEGTPRFFGRREVERRWAVADQPFLGSIVSLFSCYGAGTPDLESYPFLSPESSWKRALPEVLATQPFVGGLPQVLLNRGALAVLGHVDRAFTSSFLWRYRDRETSALRSFRDSLRGLATGVRLGHALRPLFRRSAYLAAHFLPLLEAWRYGWAVDDEMIEDQLLSFVDARSYVLLGDPAVCAKGTGGRPGQSEESESSVPDRPAALPFYLDEKLQTRARELLGSQAFHGWVHEVLWDALARRAEDS